MTKRVAVLSLFTGAGGLDIGFHRAGFSIEACVEIEPVFCATLELNRGRYLSPTCRILSEDIRGLKPNDIGMSRCDFIIGGPPCQSFSAAGRRAGGVSGINDSRGSLFEHYCRLIEHFRPRGFLFENVRGILSANGRRDWDRIVAAFGDLGYDIAHRVLDAADYGVPQHRERLILVGAPRGLPFRFPRPTHGPDSPSKAAHESCGEAVADLQDPDEQPRKYGGKYGDLLERVPPGMNYHFFTKELGCPSPLFAWRSRFSDFLYKAHPDHPTKTIVAKHGRYSGPFHWKNRKFTFAEFKRLFTFPDDYEFAGSPNVALQQLGNSVPPAFAQVLARATAAQFFDRVETVELMAPDVVLSFDRRKGDKARRTRAGTVKNKQYDCPLFDPLDSSAEPKDVPEWMYWCGYPTWKKRRRIEAPDRGESERRFAIRERVEGGRAVLDVSRIVSGRAVATRMLTYALRFHHPIGTGIRSISCDLNSTDAEDVVAAWDAVEDFLCSRTSYLSLVDVFGHFTEPHPIFDLEMTLAVKRPPFLLKFAKHFSDFSRIATDHPISLMKSFAVAERGFDFLSAVKRLRSLRFDVRVFETNTTIPPGYFRCCYPFPHHVGKQISVSWTDRADGNLGEGVG